MSLISNFPHNTGVRSHFCHRKQGKILSFFASTPMPSHKSSLLEQNLCFDPLALPTGAVSWQAVFDTLALASLEMLGLPDFTPTCHAALLGRFSSLSRSEFLTLPGGSWVSCRYQFSQPSAAVLTLKGQIFETASGALHFVNIQWSDPDWMLLRYLAQREVRSRRGLCQLCGRPMSRWEQWHRQWRHHSCSTYRIT